MRILVVSAHYPPNFVSGGSLQPQRLARALRGLGEDVHVYAGWLEGGRRAGETWSEVDESGLPVRWIATARAWTEWADERNVDNPTVTADFATYVAELRPEVVHFHALQSFGAGLLPAAKAAGAHVVVTMHDFWWCCARQFLVDREFRPCSLVVDAGVCQCHVDRRWLDRRNARVAAALRSADLVLAPSASAAEVLTANGLGPVGVDENGVVVAAGQPPKADGTLRLLFTGGADPMKGWPVLADALSQLGRTAGWRLAAYGVDAALGHLPVQCHPPFAPEGAPAVYAGADVLVLPSVMRESFSLVTREALAAGLPVVTTDTLGPEEVVVHGVNGLVVPAGDAVALAGALRQLIDEPALLGRLRSAATAPAVRTVEDQAVALRGRYEAIARGNRGLLPRNSRGLERVLFVTGIEGAPLRYRVRLPAEALGLVGVRSAVRHYRDPDLTQIARDADAVVVYRVPATTQFLEFLGGVRRHRTPVLFDVDDLIFDPELAPEIPALEILPENEAALWLEGVRRYRTTMEACDGFIGSTPMLCRHAEAVTGLPAQVFPNGVGFVQSRLADAALHRPRRPGPPRVGYLSGTDTHAADWAFLEPAVAEVLDRHREVELWLGGYVQPSHRLERFAARVVRLPFVPWTELPAILRDLDVNLVPLAPGSRFNEAKSAIKWLEAALAETVTVASPTEPFVDAIVPGSNGLLAGEPDAWTAALTHLLGNPGDGARMAARARRDALMRWSPYLQGPRYHEILSRPLMPRRAPASPWVPIALDEPPWRRRRPLEPYPPERRRWFRRSSG